MSFSGVMIRQLASTNRVWTIRRLNNSKVCLGTSAGDPKLHQTEALEAILTGLEKHDRVTAVMACGTGKTLVSLWLAERRKAQRVLVLLPSLALIRQTLHEWLKETAWERLRFIAVCSDPTVTQGVDALVVHQKDLDFPTTEVGGVREFVTDTGDGVRIVFSTYQSARAESREWALLIWASLTRPTRPPHAKARTLRSPTRPQCPNRKATFMTATPRHYDVRKKDKEGDKALVYSTDEPATYGRIVHTLSFAEAARRGIRFSRPLRLDGNRR